SHTPAPVTYAEISTGNGERKKLTLPDGSTLFINAHSSVKIPSNFGEEQREIFLSGQGTFDVVSNEAQPFIVHTGKVQTVVLGTSFDVRAYPDDKELQVAVLSGKVRIEKKTDSLNEILAAGVTQNQVLTYNEKQNSHRLKACKAEEIAGWRNNSFFFEQASLDEIAQLLERQYNVHIILNGTTKRSCRYTLQLKNETLENALRLLSQLSGVTYQANKNEIKINISSCE
ncbi:MAG TPA: FecR domain-containing protein, partial [Chitinophaga sp.]|nr:FecR domain-containing protein [Chitinophaga sp.]